ncbi:GntR family transcriptional regulator [Aeromicrobium phragmitis]|uniref:GntR family transcriptional regulator n=1 Tax=Aeromicrobium phragmitis TaxID=2478914 RepID=A0A3L8PHP3_9ACTN|nr:GntR family transcriptional regulator [Aeromicrobium phragmitis]RLV54540.1 GntR family transcriptional regulator [Aeromicrobium phragmitis]
MTATDLTAALEALTAARAEVVLTSSSDRAADAVRERVADGVLRPGDRLPEAAIAEALGISRNTLREALSQLIAERVLERQPHRGVFVRVPTAEDVRDIYRARRVIEPGCLRARRDGRTDAAALLAAVTDGEKGLVDGNGDTVASANQRFHRGIVGLAGSSRLDAEMSRLLAEMRLVFFQAGSAEDFHGPYVELNREIAEHVAAGRIDEAAALLEDYLTRAERHLLSAFGPLNAS